MCNCNCNRNTKSLANSLIKEIASKTESVVYSVSSNSRTAIQHAIENGIREALQLADVEIVQK